MNHIKIPASNTWAEAFDAIADLADGIDRADERERYERVKRLAERWQLRSESRAYGETLLALLEDQQ